MQGEKDFEIGDRVRLNELGTSRSPRIHARLGRVIAVSGLKSNAIHVLFDGNKTATRVHRSYLELDESKGAGVNNDWAAAKQKPSLG